MKHTDKNFDAEIDLGNGVYVPYSSHSLFKSRQTQPGQTSQTPGDKP